MLSTGIGGFWPCGGFSCRSFPASSRGAEGGTPPPARRTHISLIDLCFDAPAIRRRRRPTQKSLRGEQLGERASLSPDAIEDAESRQPSAPPSFPLSLPLSPVKVSLPNSRSAGGSVQTCENPGSGLVVTDEPGLISSLDGTVRWSKAYGLARVLCNLAKRKILLSCSGLVKTLFVLRGKIFHACETNSEIMFYFPS